MKEGVYFLGLIQNIRGLFFKPPESQGPQNLQAITVGNTYTRQDYDTLSSEIVFGVITQLSSNIASMPLRLYKDKNVVKSGMYGSLAYLVGYRPNKNQTAFEFIRYLEQSRNTYGNGYAHIQRDDLGRPVALQPLNASLVTLSRDEYDNLWYIYNLDGAKYVFYYRDIIHVKHHVSTSGVGISPIDVLRNTLEFERTVMHTTLEQITKSIGLTGKIVLTGTMNDKLRGTIRTMLTEIRNSDHAVVVTDPTFDYVGVDTKYFDYKALDTMSLTTQRIATAFCVPPHLAGDLSRATFSNIEAQSIDYINSTLMPIIKQYEQEFGSKLLAERDILAGFEFQFDEMELLRGDSNSRSKYYEIMLRIGAMTPNEIRIAEGMGNIEGGDERLISLNYVPYSTLELQQDVLLKTLETPVVDNTAQPQNDDDSEDDEESEDDDLKGGDDVEESM